jgi:Ala-tRNA(Pro) deacylase
MKLRLTGVSSAVFEKIKKLLDENNIKYDVLKHEPVYTSEQAAKMRGKGVEAGLRRGAKAMILKLKDKFIQCIVPAHKIVDLKKVKELVGCRPELASSEEVLKVTDCEIGSVPPFGNLFGIQVFADPELSEELDFNAGLHDTSITMKRSDWEKVVKPIIMDIGGERGAS